MFVCSLHKLHSVPQYICNKASYPTRKFRGGLELWRSKEVEWRDLTLQTFADLPCFKTDYQSFIPVNIKHWTIFCYTGWFKYDRD